MDRVADALITLTTDFGEESPYVAALKGVVLGVNPAARLVDLSHTIPPQDLRHAAFFLKHALPFFPPGTIHVIVVDPGVGGERALLYAEVGGQRLLVPDNGCWAPLAGVSSPTVRVLSDPRYWRRPVSATFHGRDILAPVAGWLSRGLGPERLGPLAERWVRLEMPEPELAADCLRGEVVFVDRFGNLITNVPGEAFAALAARPVRVTVGAEEVPRAGRAYSEVEPGGLLALVSSSGMLEIAMNQGSAAERLRAGPGTAVAVQQRSETSPSGQ